MAVADEFSTGLYRHYKGGLYTAIALVTHHETRKPMVLYVSHTFGGMNVRPLHGWEGDLDGWADVVKEASAIDPERFPPKQRFEYIGPLPSDTPVDRR